MSVICLALAGVAFPNAQAAVYCHGDFSYEIDDDDDRKVTFSAEKAQGSSPILEWNWDFGDGSEVETTYIHTVSHTYSDYGTYNLHLEIRCAYAGTVNINKVVVVPAPAACIADFDYDILNDGLTATFDSSRSGQGDDPPDSYDWEFPDGSTSNEANPEVTFGSFGLKPVTLTVTCGDDSDQIERELDLHDNSDDDGDDGDDDGDGGGDDGDDGDGGGDAGGGDDDGRTIEQDQDKTNAAPVTPADEDDAATTDDGASPAGLIVGLAGLVAAAGLFLFVMRRRLLR